MNQKITPSQAREMVTRRETKPPKVSGLEIKTYKWIGCWIASVWVIGIFEGYVGDRGNLVRRRDQARLFRSEDLAKRVGSAESLGAW